MRKVWVLEKKTTEDDVKRDREILQSIINDKGDFDADTESKIRKHLETVKAGDWYPLFVSNNYFKFYSQCIRHMGKVDSDAIQELKKSLGEVVGVSQEVRNKYRETHNYVFSQYRVVEGQVPEGEKDLYLYRNNPSKVNEGVYKYIWSNKAKA